MNAISRTASVAVLVILGLALTAQAAEPTIQAGLDKWVKLDRVFWHASRKEGPMTVPPKGEGPVPNPEAVEVRFHPNAMWCGMGSGGGQAGSIGGWLTWTYSVKTAAVPDSMKSMRRAGVMAAGMVVVYVDPQGAPAGGRYAIPEIRVVGLKDWKRMDIEIEWGFQAGTEKSDYSGRIGGKASAELDKDKETIILKGLAGTVAVTAQY